ncbi:hypothetical protein [Chitinophaga silvisoli]|uniref:hypothetical protein n=1 Tax=Chitinophaga silvisoli TaxID=2291814 RepID=UPI0011C0EBB7|nr:hypothetical protein [Chitinophaga silvisoli]
MRHHNPGIDMDGTACLRHNNSVRLTYDILQGTASSIVQVGHDVPGTHPAHRWQSVGNLPHRERTKFGQ